MSYLNAAVLGEILAHSQITSDGQLGVLQTGRVTHEPDNVESCLFQLGKAGRRGRR